MSAAKFEYNNMHWMYLLALEEDLRTLARYVEFAPENLEVFSLECTRLLLAACSEVDTVIKLLAEPHINEASKAKKTHISMGDCRQALFEHHSVISTAMVSIPRYGLNYMPWANWAKKKQPKWWDAYTLVKHQRAKHYAQATLGNVLDAIAGLFVVLLVYLRTCGVDIIMPATLLFRPYWQLGSYCISSEGHLIDLRPEHLRPEE